MEDHLRTIVHIDIDCFYAQVEMNKDPNLKCQPLGIQQKNIVVTSNYVARKYGIQKCMPISEAKKLCPKLVLVKGEDLHDYRLVSQKVTDLLKNYSSQVERLGLDENFIDITELINEKMSSDPINGSIIGCLFGDNNSFPCDCGCRERIILGSYIAQQMRNEIKEKLRLTTCAGVAHNKLLAKIVGSKNKPDKQTSIFPNSAAELMLSLETVQQIPWIGNATGELLNKIDITTVKDLQNCDKRELEKIFDAEKATVLVNLSFGIDNTIVKSSGKPQSIGLEDAGKPLTRQNEVENKFKNLLTRLLILTKEDGRVPKLIRITLKKHDPSHPFGGQRETKQCNFNMILTNEEQIIKLAMSLFWKAIDKSRPFKVTLLGLAFGKFQEKPSDKNTLSGFLKTGSSPAEPPSKRLKSVENEAKNSTESPKCPPDIDKSVFNELPPEVQKELWDDYRRNLDRDKSKSLASKRGKVNTLFNYLVKK